MTLLVIRLHMQLEMHITAELLRYVLHLNREKEVGFV